MLNVETVAQLAFEAKKARVWAEMRLCNGLNIAYLLMMTAKLS
jgi:hypothetical protein